MSQSAEDPISPGATNISDLLGAQSVLQCGEHTREILAELGYTDTEIETSVNRRIVA